MVDGVVQGRTRLARAARFLPDAAPDTSQLSLHRLTEPVSRSIYALTPQVMADLMDIVDYP
jgi:hypothetical protein